MLNYNLLLDTIALGSSQDACIGGLYLGSTVKCKNVILVVSPLLHLRVGAPKTKFHWYVPFLKRSKYLLPQKNIY